MQQVDQGVQPSYRASLSLVQSIGQLHLQNYTLVTYAFSALTLMVGLQEGHLVCKKTE